MVADYLKRDVEQERTVSYCPECGHECADVSMHPRQDGTWNERCAYCFTSTIQVKLWPCRTCAELLEELEMAEVTIKSDRAYLEGYREAVTEAAAWLHAKIARLEREAFSTHSPADSSSSTDSSTDAS